MCAYVLVVETRGLGRFWPVSWTITQFWGPGAIFTIDDPHAVFACPASILTVLVNSDRFVDYYSLFWGPKPVS